MKIRKLPLGYCIQNGEVCIHEHDADTVHMIFDHYIQGASYAQVVGILEQQGIPYILDRHWNKNIVARILQDRRYVGDGTYPQLLTPETFHAAQVALPSSCESPEQIRLTKNIRALVRCPSCGKSMPRNHRANWQCPDCMTSSVKVTDEALKMGATELLEQLIKSSPDMEMPDASFHADTVHDLETELEQAMNVPDFDEDTAKIKAIALATARFDALGSEDYETMRLKYRLSHREQDGELDAGLLFAVTAAILIYPSGAVSLRLKNGQVIGGGQSR